MIFFCSRKLHCSGIWICQVKNKYFDYVTKLTKYWCSAEWFNPLPLCYTRPCFFPFLFWCICPISKWKSLQCSQLADYILFSCLSIFNYFPLLITSLLMFFFKNIMSEVKYWSAFFIIIEVLKFIFFKAQPECCFHDLNPFSFNLKKESLLSFILKSFQSPSEELSVSIWRAISYKNGWYCICGRR